MYFIVSLKLYFLEVLESPRYNKENVLLKKTIYVQKLNTMTCSKAHMFAFFLIYI